MSEVFTPKQARLLCDKSQSEMACLMNIHPQTYRKLEKHPDLMTVKQACLFCKIVKRDIGEIFFDKISSLTRE